MLCWSRNAKIISQIITKLLKCHRRAAKNYTYEICINRMQWSFPNANSCTTAFTFSTLFSQWLLISECMCELFYIEGLVVTCYTNVLRSVPKQNWWSMTFTSVHLHTRQWQMLSCQQKPLSLWTQKTLQIPPVNSGYYHTGILLISRQ